MVSSPLFIGCATALVTPFQSDGSLDEAALRRLIGMQLDASVEALVLLGTTGEPCSLTMDERARVIEIGLTACEGRIPVIVGTGSNDTRRAMDFALQAKRLGAQGQLCVTPYYNKTTQNGLIRHYSAILDCCDLPMILYNVPGRTGMSISAQAVTALSGHPNLAGIKEASGELDVAREMLEKTDGRLPIYCGNDDLIVSVMRLGAQGAISVCSNIVPIQTRLITEACLCGDYTQASAVLESLLPVIRLLFSQTNPIPVKYALSTLGWIKEELRLPLVPLEEPYRTRLFKELQTLSPHDLPHA